MKSETPSVPFEKFHGTGNDFILIDGFHYSFNPEQSLVGRMCNRHLGIGADGLILLVPDDNSDFRMHYYNSDGLPASMCGNGGRTAVAFAYKHGIIRERKTTFNAYDGLHHAEVCNVKNRISEIDLTLNVGNSVLKISDSNFFVDTGSPHLIVIVNDVNQIDVFSVGRKLRYSEIVPEGGANVNFIHFVEGKIFIRTYERGVENETLSCGTGTVAAALACSEIFSLTGQQVFEIETLGGILKVGFISENGIFKDVHLKGPAEFVFNGFF